MEEKQALTTKSRISFYRTCYENLGYRLAVVQKIDRNYVLRFVREHAETEIVRRKREYMEERLRWIELISRKKSGFQSLHRNLSIHIGLFCIQAAVLYSLNLEGAHPREMLEIGVVLFLCILAAGLFLKLLEILRWNREVRRLKEELLHAEGEEGEQRESGFHTVSVLFTRSHGLIPELIYWLTGRQYTHASLGIDETLETFYSFDGRGFRTEHPAHRRIKGDCRESLCYQFRVTEEEYDRIRQSIQLYAKEKTVYRYNLVGVIFSALHIYMPVKTGRVYFCSEFVTEQLKTIKDIRLGQSANMYLPSNLAKALIRQKNLYRVLVNEI